MSQIIDWEQRPPTTITVQSIETVKSPYECDRKQENMFSLLSFAPKILFIVERLGRFLICKRK